MKYKLSRFSLLSLLVMLSSLWGSSSAFAADQWVKVEPTDLSTGDVVVIVDQTSSRAMSNSNGTSNPPAATAVTLNADKSQIEPGENGIPATLQWNVEVSMVSYPPTGVSALYNAFQFSTGEGDSKKYLYCTNTNNGVRVGTNANNTFIWTYSPEDVGYLLNTATSRYIGVYAEQDWRCYTSVNENIKNSVTAFYKKVAVVEPANYTVTFHLDDFAEGVAPDAITVEAGSAITIPQNRTMYRDGYTLVGWGTTQVLKPGDEVTVAGDMDLYPVWRENTLTLADVSGEAEAEWFFGESNGAPSVDQLQGGKTILVTQIDFSAGESSETQDLKLEIDATNGKYHNKGRHDILAQTNSGTKLIFPATKGADVELDTYYVPTGTTLDGAEMTADGSQGSAYATGVINTGDNTATITINNAGYSSKLRVIYNEQQDEVEWQWRDIAVDLVNIFGSNQPAEKSDQEMGIVVDENGTNTVVDKSTENANIYLSGKYWNSHGWVNTEATVRVEGPVRIDLGNCYFGSGDITVKDVTGAPVASGTMTSGQDCWKPDQPTNIVSVNYTGGATTLTISYPSYLPYIAVTKVDEPVVVPTNVAINFLPSDDNVQGVMPAAIESQTGAQVQLPKNFTVYKEGYTLTGWYDAETKIGGAPGETITIPEDYASETLNLTSVFTENTVSLADRTEPVTVKFDFMQQSGAPSVTWEGIDGNIWVTQSVVNGQTIDVATVFSTKPGKFNNSAWNDWCQINVGTAFGIPSCKGAVVSIEAFNTLGVGEGKEYLTIDGQHDYEPSKNVSYTIQGNLDPIVVRFGDEGTYYRYIQVVLPVVESSGTTYTNAPAQIVWPMSNPDTPAAYTVTPEGMEDAFSLISQDLGTLQVGDNEGGNKTGTSNSDPGYTFIQLWNYGGTKDSPIQWSVTPAAGLTFTPTEVSGHIVRFGTNVENGVTVSAKTADGEPIVLGTFTAVRNNSTLDKDKYANNPNLTTQFVIQLTEEQQQALTAAGGFTLIATVGVGNNKSGGFADVTINGLVNGTASNVEKYTLDIAAEPDEGGSVSVYPVADEYEAGTEVTLTATENFGYDFVAWRDAAGTPVSTEARFKYTINDNTTLVAEFQQVETYAMYLTVDGANDYMVTADPAPTDIGGVGMYEAGTTVKLTANQYDGLVTFLGWSDQTTNSEKEITIGEDIDIVAHYEQADIIAGWDFYTPANANRKADFYSAANSSDVLTLVNTATGNTGSWLDKSTVSQGGYEGFKGAAVNWQVGTADGDVGNWHWQTKVNASDFTGINVQFQMLYNYNAYQTYNVEWSLDGQQWTKAGSITMSGAKTPASFNGQLPAEADNQEELYIRLIADKESPIDGSVSKNDGNALAMFFITGTPGIIDDGTAPVLVSTVPEDGATGASARGKIVLTFDERVKLPETHIPSGVLSSDEGETELTPAVNGKSVTFNYTSLGYNTRYTFQLPANSIADLTNNFLNEEITFSFTTMERPTVEKKLYDEVVENVDQLVAALQNAENRSDKNSRYRIFIKDGDYKLPLKTTMKTVNGFEVPENITFINASNISFIGEHLNGVNITNDIDPNLTFVNPYGTASQYEGIGNSDVFQIGYSASGLYWQDLTVTSGMEDKRGRGIAIQDMGTRNIYKFVKLYGYQDTWVSNNDLGLYYFEDGIVRGCTDYLCGKGDIYFNRMELQQVAGGYLAVPSRPVNIGWIFKDCTINGDGSDVDNRYTLGRPWGNGTPIALFIDTKMNVVPEPVGWSEMSGGWPSRFAEYNSTDANGSPVSLSERKKEFGNEGDKHTNNPVLSAEEASYYSDMSNMYGDWDPTLATEQAPVPTDVQLAGTTLTWTGSEYALLYAICKDGHVVDFTLDEEYTVDDPTATWTIRAANEMGGLCEESQVAEVVPVLEEETTDDRTLPTVDGGGVYYATTFGNYAYRINGNTTAYTATVSGNGLLLSEVVDNIIPEGSPVILKSSETPIVITPLDEEQGKYTDTLDKAFANNDLKGQNSKKYPTADNPVYVLDKQGDVLGFYRTDEPVDAFTAFIVTDAATAPERFILVPDYTTAAFNLNSASPVQVQFFRTFDRNVASTLCLPFQFDPSSVGTLYRFVGVDKNEYNQWTATMQETTNPAEANVPYLFMPQVTKTLKYVGEFTPSQTSAGNTTSGDWRLNGTYSDILWDTDNGITYGFSADDVSSIKAGDFVKVGAYSKIRPLRAYMTYIGSGAAPAPARHGLNRESLPERIQVVLLDANGETTGIGELNTETGDVNVEWFDLNGRKLNNQPRQKGVYIQDGKKVVVK